jgi:hypothetical protein
MEKFIVLNFLLSVHLSISMYGADFEPSVYATDLCQANYHIQEQYVLVNQLLASNACCAACVCIRDGTRWLKMAMLKGTKNHAVDW